MIFLQSSRESTWIRKPGQADCELSLFIGPPMIQEELALLTVAIDTRGINYDSPGVLTVGTIPIDTRFNCDAPNVLTIGTMLIDTNGVKYDMPSNLTVGTIALDPKDIHTAGSVPSQ